MLKQYGKKIYATTIVLLFAFLLTIGSTYAWFTLSEGTQVQGLQFSLTTSESLLILMDNGSYDLDDPDDYLYLTTPTNYVTSLTTAKIKEQYDFTEGRIQMYPVTSLDGRVMKDLLGNVQSASPNALNPGKYISFDVWIYSPAQSASIGLADYSSSGTNGSVEFKNLVKNSVRLSITKDSFTRIFGHDKDYDFQFQPGMAGYNPALTSMPLLEQQAVSLLHGLYFSNDPILNESSNQKINVDTPELATTELFVLAAGVPQKISIRIWIEGWDSEANNNVIAATFSLSFSFIVRNSA